MGSEGADGRARLSGNTLKHFRRGRYLAEGNKAYYTSSAIARRCFLVRDLGIREATTLFWSLASNSGESITKDEYTELMTYVAQVLVGGALSDADIAAAIEMDWQKDLKRSEKSGHRNELSVADLHLSLYELADVWVDGINGAKYAAFLLSLLYCCLLYTSPSPRDRG